MRKLLSFLRLKIRIMETMFMIKLCKYFHLVLKQVKQNCLRMSKYFQKFFERSTGIHLHYFKHVKIKQVTLVMMMKMQSPNFWNLMLSKKYLHNYWVHRLLTNLFETKLLNSAILRVRSFTTMSKNNLKRSLKQHTT